MTYISKQYKPEELKIALELVKDGFDNWMQSDQIQPFENYLLLLLQGSGYRIVKTGLQE
jgi:hypothetical protein